MTRPKTIKNYQPECDNCTGNGSWCYCSKCKSNSEIVQKVREWMNQLDDTVNFHYNDKWLDTQISDKLKEVLGEKDGT